MMRIVTSLQWLRNAPARRIATIGALLLIIMLAHWMLPMGHYYWHVMHVSLRKLFIVPVVLAAIWFNLRGALCTSFIVTILYLPYILIQWLGQYSENINQVGELTTVWVTAILAGVLVGLEKRALRRLADTHEGALIALVGALDAREHDTQLHSLRVRSFSLRLGRELRMDARGLAILGQAALLHDVGKIGVPDSILLKPDSLTDDEWKSMREHAAIGYRILKPVHFLRAAAEIVHYHHEKYDGSGYPNSVAGDQIPLGARVFAVVDAYDALVSSRPYHDGVSFGNAKRRILAGTGTHFDPEVVAAFCAIPQAEWEQIAADVEAHPHFQELPLAQALGVG